MLQEVTTLYCLSKHVDDEELAPVHIEYDALRCKNFTSNKRGGNQMQEALLIVSMQQVPVTCFVLSPVSFFTKKNGGKNLAVQFLFTTFAEQKD